MARVWRRNGVRRVWVWAGVYLAATLAASVWVYAPLAIGERFGLIAVLAWELPTLGASLGAVRFLRWSREATAARLAEYLAEAPDDADVIDEDQNALPGMDASLAEDDDGPYESCSLDESAEHG